jgi:hypothetical protein
MAVDIVIQETIDLVDITVNPNIIEVNVTRTSGGGGGVQSVTGTTVDNTDPLNPVVGVPNLTQVLTVGDKEFQQIDGDRDFELADRLKYSQILAGTTMTLDDDLDLFPPNSLIQFFVNDNSDINATATLNFGAGTSCYYLIENITTLTLNVGDFCELKKASAGSVWVLNVWNKSTGGGGAVDSVNGQTGVVVLDATDVGAPSGSGTSTGTNTGDQDLSGLVAKSAYTPAHSILVQQSGTGSPTSLQIANNTLVGRLSGGGSNINDLSVSDVKGLLDFTTPTDVQTIANAKVTDAIVDGVTTVAPSQNAVFDALQFTRKLITNGTGSVTGTTSETILTSLTIPANTLDSKCFIWSTMDYFKTNSGSCTLRLYVNSANSLSGATLIGFLILGSNRNASFNRKLYLNGTTLDFLVSSASSTQINNEFIEALFGASTTLTVDPTANIFLIYTTQNDVVGTVATSKQATVQKMKLN